MIWLANKNVTAFGLLVSLGHIDISNGYVSFKYQEEEIPWYDGQFNEFKADKIKKLLVVDHYARNASGKPKKTLIEDYFKGNVDDIYDSEKMLLEKLFMTLLTFIGNKRMDRITMSKIICGEDKNFKEHFLYNSVRFLSSPAIKDYLEELEFMDYIRKLNISGKDYYFITKEGADFSYIENDRKAIVHLPYHYSLRHLELNDFRNEELIHQVLDDWFEKSGLTNGCSLYTSTKAYENFLKQEFDFNGFKTSGHDLILLFTHNKVPTLKQFSQFVEYYFDINIPFKFNKKKEKGVHVIGGVRYEAS